MSENIKDKLPVANAFQGAQFGELKLIFIWR